VPVGSTRVVERAVRRDDVHVVSNPEFLREGTAVNDFLHPDRVVIGAADRGAAERVAALYSGLGAEILITDPASAETIKYAANGFLAMKISFVNAVAAMCEAVGADVSAVVQGIGSDTRIGSAFLNPGPGWGGSCFPKDSRALVRIAQDHGYNFSMMRGVIEVNDEQRSRMVDKVIRALEGHERSVLSGSRVGVLGLTFKAGTDDLRDSPSIAVIRDLIRFGSDISAYDPTVIEPLHPARAAALQGVTLCADPYAAATDVDVVVILTEWPEFKELDLDKMATVMAGRAIVDTRNLLDPAVVRAAGLAYAGVGRR
jgi:UDPglucose 6-dehydrogenase